MPYKDKYKKKKGSLTSEEMEAKYKKNDGDGYLFDVEYDKLKQEREKIEKEYADEREEYLRITEQLRAEMLNGTASESDVSRFMTALTNKGVELEQQQQDLQKRIDTLSGRVSDIENQMNELRVKAFGGNTRAYASVDENADYKGFKLDQTDNRYSNARIVEMSPEEYLRRVAFDIKGSSVGDLLKNASSASVEKYMRQMLRGVRFNSPSINTQSGRTVGDERAIAAMMNGYKRIPVMIVE